MSKKGDGGSTAAVDAQARLAQQLFDQTDPLRQSLISRSEDFLSSPNSTESPSFLAFKQAADSQFGQAKDNVIARTAPGGALTDALVDLESNRAGALTQGAGQAYEQDTARAMTLATGTTGQALGGLGQAGATQAAMAQANAQQSAGKAGGLGEAAGAAIGKK